MSPRSTDYMRLAGEKLDEARTAREAGVVGSVIGIAYYACLFAARAALSERDRYAKTHSGTWALFGELFVRDGGFDAGLSGEVARLRELREAADYDVGPITPGQADAAIRLSERFVAAVRAAWP